MRSVAGRSATSSGQLPVRSTEHRSGRADVAAPVTVAAAPGRQLSRRGSAHDQAWSVGGRTATARAVASNSAVLRQNRASRSVCRAPMPHRRRTGSDAAGRALPCGPLLRRRSSRAAPTKRRSRHRRGAAAQPHRAAYLGARPGGRRRDGCSVDPRRSVDPRGSTPAARSFWDRRWWAGVAALVGAGRKTGGVIGDLVGLAEAIGAVSD
jgi:hypothetical protein